LHWEYFYDERGKALVRLHRIMGKLRREHPALRSRGYFYYYHDSDHLQRGVIAFRRETAPLQGNDGESVLVFLLAHQAQEKCRIARY
jgi:pullulanase/glycogen debranching enzyme